MSSHYGREGEYRAVTYNANTINSIKPSTLPSLLPYQFIQPLAPALLHPFKAAFQIDWKLDIVGMVVLEDVEPAEDGPFVVRGAAADELAVGGVNGEDEGIGVPAVRDVRLPGGEGWGVSV